MYPLWSLSLWMKCTCTVPIHTYSCTHIHVVYTFSTNYKLYFGFTKWSVCSVNVYRCLFTCISFNSSEATVQAQCSLSHTHIKLPAGESCFKAMCVYARVCVCACVCMYYPTKYLHIATSHVIKQAIIHVSLSKLSLYLIQCNYCFSRISSNLTDVQ